MAVDKSLNMSEEGDVEPGMLWLARCLDLGDQKEVDQFVLPDDRVRLLVFARLPENLYVTGSKFGIRDSSICRSICRPGRTTFVQYSKS